MKVYLYYRKLEFAGQVINIKKQWLKLRRFMIMTGCIHDILNEKGSELLWRQDKT